MARIIGSFGYNVDVVYNRDAEIAKSNKLNKYKYDMIVGLIPRGIDFWTGHMNEGCIRVAYLTCMNLEVNAANQIKRLKDLEQRRGHKLPGRLIADEIHTKDIENFNAAWNIGNAYNYHSYDSFKMPPMYYIKNNGYIFDWVNRDIIRDKHSFIFFNSRGMVHKGLDLLLEIFGREGFPYNLYICSCFNEEKEFCAEYDQELYHRPNIFPIGFIDIHGPEFREVTEKCAYTILPSCAEGQAGSLLTMMSAGVIPIASKECGFDGDEVILLDDCKIETIERYIEEYAHKPDEWIHERSEFGIDLVKRKYTREDYCRSVREAMTATLKEAGLL